MAASEERSTREVLKEAWKIIQPWAALVVVLIVVGYAVWSEILAEGQVLK